MTWFLFALIGYFLYAVVTALNKFLLRQRAVTKPVVFTFWVGLLSIFSFILFPFGLKWPGTWPFIIDLAVGALYFIYILYFYEALDVNEASRSTSVIGGLMPVVILIFSYAFLAEKLALTQIIAFILLIIGGFLVTLKKGRSGIKGGTKGNLFIVLAILFGAIYWIAEKYVFNNQGFVTGFVWSRMGFVLASLAILARGKWRREIFSSGRQASGGLSLMFVAVKALAAFGSLFVHWALSLGNVALVNAMQGLEYAFLFIIAVFLSKKFPEFLEEKTNTAVLVQKIIAIILIGAGLALLAL